MPRGGRRTGAGRKKGSVTKKTAAIALKLAETGATPLEVLLSVIRDEGQPLALRVDCAKSAAPFIHPRLAATVIERRPNSQVLQDLLERVRADKNLGPILDQQPAALQAP